MYIKRSCRREICRRHEGHTPSIRNDGDVGKGSILLVIDLSSLCDIEHSEGGVRLAR